MSKVFPTCPLCHGLSAAFYKDEFFECVDCAGVFRPRAMLPSAEDERKRYEEHHNDVNDPGYRAFVSPITARVFEKYAPGDLGLDFGSGTGPVISKVLQEKGYSIEQYDPFFSDDPSLLERTYDYVVCCEVIEHFHDPEKEFRLLKKLLKPGGRLYCMTYLYDTGIDFINWHYRRDPTHVFIYTKKTLSWIKEAFDFAGLRIDDRLIELQRA